MSQQAPSPVVAPDQDGSSFATVRGIFHRAVRPEHAEAVLRGSRTDGRYGSADRPTLYLSSSPEGVAAAMTKYVTDRRSLAVERLEVAASGIADLRDAAAMARLGINPADAATDWQRALAAGEVPASWRVRDALQDAGAHGLIDPSRKRPGLWHLTLFAWNQDDAPTVRLLTSQAD